MPTSPRSLLRVARVAAIPAAVAVAFTASASGVSQIRIQSGDTVSAIAARYHTTVDRIVKLNHLKHGGNLIYAGELLKVPGSHSASAGGGGGSRTSTHMGVIYHTVVSGDTLYGIAAHYHVNPLRIAHRNHLSSSLVVVLGQRLAIPHRVTTTRSSGSTSGSTTVSSTTQATRDRNYLAHRAEPSQTTVGAMIRSTAARWGVDPRLAQAIAWQESGWNMRAVSSVDAIGAMQVMRYTGAWLSTDVVHRNLNLFDAQDNITAGVSLLSVLTHSATSMRQAVAGYYQGLHSVRVHGMYASTKQYVRNVMALRQRY
ncbi:MAG: LysM peptidoglycan-binding domain-containing protein [Frankiaceae bacterium]|nr:LysM peptidoglycan-binding domain-containing protein [Frankiaceae bacterium]